MKARDCSRMDQSLIFEAFPALGQLHLSHFCDNPMLGDHGDKRPQRPDKNSKFRKRKISASLEPTWSGFV